MEEADLVGREGSPVARTLDREHSDPAFVTEGGTRHVALDPPPAAELVQEGIRAANDRRQILLGSHGAGTSGKQVVDPDVEADEVAPIFLHRRVGTPPKSRDP
ncbi:MAG: hypothetical protein R3E53_08465 [Myxococcota bacterium]